MSYALLLSYASSMPPAFYIHATWAAYLYSLRYQCCPEPLLTKSHTAQAADTRSHARRTDSPARSRTRRSGTQEERDGEEDCKFRKAEEGERGGADGGEVKGRKFLDGNIHNYQDHWAE
jgi:hypothetical protein